MEALYPGPFQNWPYMYQTSCKNSASLSSERYSSKLSKLRGVMGTLKFAAKSFRSVGGLGIPGTCD